MHTCVRRRRRAGACAARCGGHRAGPEGRASVLGAPGTVVSSARHPGGLLCFPGVRWRVISHIFFLCLFFYRTLKSDTEIAPRQELVTCPSISYTFCSGIGKPCYFLARLIKQGQADFPLLLQLPYLVLELKALAILFITNLKLANLSSVVDVRVSVRMRVGVCAWGTPLGGNTHHRAHHRAHHRVEPHRPTRLTLLNVRGRGQSGRCVCVYPGGPPTYLASRLGACA